MKPFLESGLDGSPGGFFVIRRNNSGDLATFAEMEIGDRGIEDFVFTTVDFDVVFVVVMNESADDGATLDWADLLIEEATFRGDCELQNVALDEFRFGSVVRGDGIVLPVGANHNLAIEDTFDDFAFRARDDGLARGGDSFTVAEDGDKKFFCGSKVRLGFLD